ncbi:MAG TPA: hypothetical protein PLU30_14985 [Verrucomicrobiae bacterium]|nr:hypothetical protein [Verrucomicrobiae bacterium]
MRGPFNRDQVDISRNDDRIRMMLADIGYGEIEPFRDAQEFGRDPMPRRRGAIGGENAERQAAAERVSVWPRAQSPIAVGDRLRGG